MSTQRKVRRHAMSVSATELAKLGLCEVMVALELADAADEAMVSSAKKGEREHERFHIRAVLNAGVENPVARG